MKKILIITSIALMWISCTSDNEPQSTDKMYFPSTTDTIWERISPAKLGWNTDKIAALNTYLAQKHSKSFIILVNGRIVMENYYNGHTSTDSWQWNSAGKTLVASTTGIAEQEGYLNINAKVSNYIGWGWTSETLAKEALITVRHLLTMTSGLNDSSNLVIRPNLTYMVDAGTRWSYANVFQKLTDVVAETTGQPFEDYFNSRLKNKIGMDGFWNFGPIFTIYHSSTRSMARFGLLALNNGKWNGNQIVNSDFFTALHSSSQTINPSYGYLCWLNGKSSFMIPGGQTVYSGSLVPNAPADMFAAMGAEDQRVYVVPSLNMVVVRMGDASDPLNPSFAVSGFDDELWAMINAVIK